MQNVPHPAWGTTQPVPLPVAPDLQSTQWPGPMLGVPLQGARVVLPLAPQVGAWPQQVPAAHILGAVPAPAPIAPPKEPTKTARAKGVARARWNHDEEEKLQKLVDEHGAKRSWQKISETLGSGRTASGVEQHWQVMTGQRQRNGATVTKEAQAAVPNALLAVGQKDGGSGAERRTSARWTQDEEARLRDAVAELGKGKWTLVAERLGTGRSPSAVEQHWQIVTGQRKSKGRHASAHQQHRTQQVVAPQVYSVLGANQPVPLEAPVPREKGGARWTPDEEVQLKALIEEVGAKGQWRVIAERLRSGRSPGAVEQHWQIMTGGRKGSSATRLAQQAAAGESDDDPAKARNAKSRAVAHRWTPQEETELSNLVEDLGSRGKWPQIAERLTSGRTASGVEQHWKIMHGSHHGAKRARLAPPAPPAMVVSAAPPPPLPPQASLLGQARPVSLSVAGPGVPQQAWAPPMHVGYAMPPPPM